MSDLSLDGGIRLPEPRKGDRAVQVGSTHHFTGCVVLGDGPGARTETESHLEHSAVLITHYRRSTAQVCTQVLFEWFDEFGEIHKHFIDMLVDGTDGSRVGYAVRPVAHVSKSYLLTLARIKDQAIKQGFLDAFLLLTEQDICPIELFNAELFLSVRRPDCFGDPVAQDVVRGMTGVVSVGDLVAATRLGGMGFRAIARLICSGDLETLSYERITHETMVFKKKEV